MVRLGWLGLNALATVLTVATVLVVVHLWNDHKVFHQIVDLLSRQPAQAQPTVTPLPSPAPPQK